jgi:hypothetical protein
VAGADLGHRGRRGPGSPAGPATAAGPLRIPALVFVVIPVLLLKCTQLAGRGGSAAPGTPPVRRLSPRGRGGHPRTSSVIASRLPAWRVTGSAHGLADGGLASQAPRQPAGGGGRAAWGWLEALSHLRSAQRPAKRLAGSTQPYLRGDVSPWSLPAVSMRKMASRQVALPSGLAATEGGPRFEAEIAGEEADDGATWCHAEHGRQHRGRAAGCLGGMFRRGGQRGGSRCQRPGRVMCCPGAGGRPRRCRRPRARARPRRRWALPRRRS